MQERRNSIANALELRLSYTNPWCDTYTHLHGCHNSHPIQSLHHIIHDINPLAYPQHCYKWTCSEDHSTFFPWISYPILPTAWFPPGTECTEWLGGLSGSVSGICPAVCQSVWVCVGHVTASGWNFIIHVTSRINSLWPGAFSKPNVHCITNCKFSWKTILTSVLHLIYRHQIRNVNH